jgi:hypothetical protein
MVETDCLLPTRAVFALEGPSTPMTTEKNMQHDNHVLRWHLWCLAWEQIRETAGI